MAQDGVLLLGLSLLVTILGMHLYYRVRGHPINSSVAGLVMGMCTGAIVFSDVWWNLFGYVSHRSIQLDNKVRFCARSGPRACLQRSGAALLPTLAGVDDGRALALAAPARTRRAHRAARFPLECPAARTDRARALATPGSTAGAWVLGSATVGRRSSGS